MSLKLEAQFDFLFQTYFGGKGDELDRFISRAYRDMNRTLSGMGKQKDKSDILNGAKEVVRQQLNDLIRTSPEKAKLGDQFEHWHSTACKKLKEFYDSRDTNPKINFTYGQAQKWINMTMKYCWVCGGNELERLQPWFVKAHVAVDEVILIAAEKEKVVSNRPCEKWSKWDSEQEYSDFQKTLREVATTQNKSPMELEFDWWNKYRSELNE